MPLAWWHPYSKGLYHSAANWGQQINKTSFRKSLSHVCMQPISHSEKCFLSFVTVCPQTTYLPWLYLYRPVARPIPVPTLHSVQMSRVGGWILNEAYLGILGLFVIEHMKHPALSPVQHSLDIQVCQHSMVYIYHYTICTRVHTCTYLHVRMPEKTTIGSKWPA